MSEKLLEKQNELLERIVNVLDKHQNNGSELVKMIYLMTYSQWAWRGLPEVTRNYCKEKISEHFDVQNELKRG